MGRRPPLDLFATAAGGAEPDILIADMLDKTHLASLIAGGVDPSDQPEAQLDFTG